MSGQITGKAQCVSLLQDCLALQLQRVGPPNSGSPAAAAQDPQYWMYDSGYVIFQGFLEANLKCFWDGSLVAAVKGLEFMGYVCPGILLVTGSPPSLHLIRSAWSRSVLKPPPNYSITLLGDVEDCTVSKVQQSGFTPLADAVCWVILQLGAAGQVAVLDTIRSAIASSFPAIEVPTTTQLYDTLADLTACKKVYQTVQGYFVATPDSVRLTEAASGGGRNILLSQAEAAALVHGEIVTIREGHKTHQSIQTNLADVICGGNKNDKVLYPRTSTRGTSHRKLERRHSMRLLGSSRKLSTLYRAGSVRLLHPNTENAHKKCSIFSKIFRWPRKHPPAGSNSAPSLSEQTPPVEWFNSSVLNCRSASTQTVMKAPELITGTSDWGSECGTIRSRRRSLSTSRLPRRASRAPSMSPLRPSSPSTPSSSKTILCNATPKAMSSASSGYNSLPRSHKSRPKSAATSSQNSPKTTPRHAGKNSHSSIKVELSSNPSQGLLADTKVDTRMTTTNDQSAMVTTTINGPNSTKIYLQQQNSPMRSVITFEKAKKPSCREPTPDRKYKEEDRNPKPPEGRRMRRPMSMYQNKEVVKEKSDTRSNVSVGQLENNHKMKFPSTETIQLEEKLLSTDDKNHKNLINKKNALDTANLSCKTGSLVDVAHHAESRLNNVKKASFSLSPLKPALSSDRVLEGLNIKNILKENGPGSPTKIDDKNLCNVKLKHHLEKELDLPLKPGDNELCPFPSLSNLSLHFTSLAAQNILNGVSINSIDTLVEVNMAAEKHNSIHTDLGVV